MHLRSSPCGQWARELALEALGVLVLSLDRAGIIPTKEAQFKISSGALPAEGQQAIRFFCTPVIALSSGWIDGLGRGQTHRQPDIVLAPALVGHNIRCAPRPTRLKCEPILIVLFVRACAAKLSPFAAYETHFSKQPKV